MYNIKAAINRLLPYLLEDKKLKNICFVLLAGLLAGCSSSGNVVNDTSRAVKSQFADIEKLTEQLRTEQVNPVPLNKLAFRMLSLESTNRIDITADSPIVNFPEGNSFVAALLLPERMSSFSFSLDSITGRTVFMPSVLFLDKNFQEIVRIDDVELNNRALSLQKDFSEEMANKTRYILVYTKDSELDGKTALRDIAREYEEAKGNELSEITYPKPYAKHSPIGNINVSLKNVFFSAQTIDAGLVPEDSAQNKTVTLSTAPLVEAPIILSDTEAFYLQQISKAIKDDNLSRAKSLVEEAERAG